MQFLDENMRAAERREMPACIQPLRTIQESNAPLCIQVAPGSTIGIVDADAFEITYVSFSPQETSSRRVRSNVTGVAKSTYFKFTYELSALTWGLFAVAQIWLLVGQVALWGAADTILWILVTTLVPTAPLFVHASIQQGWVEVPAKMLLFLYGICIQVGLACYFALTGHAHSQVDNSVFLGRYLLAAVTMCFILVLDILYDLLSN